MRVLPDPARRGRAATGYGAHRRATAASGVRRDEMAARVRDLWQQRLAAVDRSDEDGAGEELRGFAWWFASGKLDAD